jgi:methylated-DNA-[protein]-cysteine S-methyltransferase
MDQANHKFIIYIERERKMKTFSDKVYDLLRKVPKGRVTTYKAIAHALGTRAYRGVGQAMKRNPYAPEVP